MRISDWSSDVCSSDLPKAIAILRYGVIEAPFHQPQRSLPACHRSDRDAVPSGVHTQSHHRSNAWNKDYLKVWWIEASRSQTTRFENALRSEEHTSELQSLMRISYAVFCLQKKK